MHTNCYKLFQKFISEHLTEDTYDIADVGSYDVNGSLKPLLDKWDYTGIDIEAGPNVDIVVEPYNFGDKEYDVVVSANCMEHVEDLHKWAQAVIKIMKPGGLLIITTPFWIEEHKYPIDCWRILPDGIRFLFKELEIIDTQISDMDTYLIAKKLNE